MGVSPGPWSTECPAQPAASARPVRPSPSAPRCSSAQGADTRAPNGIRAWVQPTVRRPAPSRRPSRMPGGEAIPTSASTRTTTTGLTPLPGRRAVSQLLLALGSPRIRHHWAHQLAPSISEPGEASEASRQASAAKHDSPHSRPISTASDVQDAGAETPVSRPAARSRIRSSEASDGLTERRRSYGGAVSALASSSATAQSSQGPPRGGGTTPLQGPGLVRSGTEGGPARAPVSYVRRKELSGFWLLVLSGAERGRRVPRSGVDAGVYAGGEPVGR